jgi:fibro-slime domain-containing protein
MMAPPFGCLRSWLLFCLSMTAVAGCARAVRSNIDDDPGAGGNAGNAGNARDGAADRPRASMNRDGFVVPETEQICNRELRAVVRDFRGFPGPNNEPKHPDFEFAVGRLTGIVAPLLGGDDKPVYAPPGATAVTNGPDAFAQWYRDVTGVNMRFEITIPLTGDPARAGVFVFDSDAFFPIDDQGFKNQYQSHNYDFTTELHFNFPYHGGEVFTFRGDDDVWLFVNGHLAIDLGGVHVADTGSVNLDQQATAFSLEKGRAYRMDIFQAERHLSDSTFHIETTLDCIDNIIVP